MGDYVPDKPSQPLDGARLLEVIRFQGEIAKLGLDLGAVMARVAERTQQLTPAIGAVVELLEGDDLVYRAATGVAESHLGMRLQRAGSLSGHCIRDGAALSCVDSESDPRVNREACRQIGLRSMIVVPLRHYESVVGVLKVLSDRPGAFDQADLGILELMSEVIAAAMFHAARYEANELLFRATHDALTGLPNRSLFYERLHQRLADAAQPFSVLNLDMDGLKPINDRLGHRFGDAAIKELGARIKRACRETDTVARVGGDEFGVILPGVGNRDTALNQAQRVAAQIAEPFEFEWKPVALGASIGVAIYPEDGQELDHLLDKADQSMYRAKRERSTGPSRSDASS